MAKAWLEDKATWLFDLAHDDLDEDAIVKGFLNIMHCKGREWVMCSGICTFTHTMETFT